MPYNNYITVSRETYNVLMNRYDKFLDACNDVNKQPVNIFGPLDAKQLEELALIREVSKGLQIKKEEDMKKAEQAEEAEEKAKEVAAQEAAEELEAPTETTPSEA